MIMDSSQPDYEFQDRESALNRIENYRSRLETLQNKLADAKTMAFQRWPSLREEVGADDRTGEGGQLRQEVSKIKKGYAQLWQTLKVYKLIRSLIL
jgi:hypothetical protein